MQHTYRHRVPTEDHAITLWSSAVMNHTEDPCDSEFLLHMYYGVSSVIQHEPGRFPAGLCLALVLVAHAFIP
jgi:hypothetical protein